jgi:hypothetical protein
VVIGGSGGTYVKTHSVPAICYISILAMEFAKCLVQVSNKEGALILLCVTCPHHVACGAI